MALLYETFTGVINELLAQLAGAGAPPVPHPNPFALRADGGLLSPPPWTAVTPAVGDDSRFYPTRATLERSLGAPLSVADREKAVRDRLELVTSAWNRLQSAPSTHGQAARLTKARAVAKALPAPTLPAAKVDVALWLRLTETAGTIETGEEVGNNAAWKLVSAQAANPATPVKLTAHVGSAAAAAAILVQLRRLNDIVDRFDAACQAWDVLLGELAKILAFWRTEGDLLVPPSRQSLSGADVPAVHGVAMGLPPGRTQFGRHAAGDPPALMFSPDNSHGTYVADESAAAANGFAGSRILDLANLSYWLMMAGLDDMLTRKSLPHGATTKDWLDANDPGAWAEFTRGYQTLHHESRAGCWVVTSDDPVLLTKIVLAEGVRFMRRVGAVAAAVGGPPAGELPDVLQYLAFHQGVGRFRGIALSALVAARKSSTPHARPLRAAITAADATTKAALRSTGSTTDATVALAASNWAVIGPFLLRPGMLAALDDFVRKADDVEWSGWPEPRSNAIRYDRLLTFYRLLFPTAVL